MGHLRVLARLSRLLADPGFVDGLRHAPDARSAHEMIAEFENRLA